MTDKNRVRASVVSAVVTVAAMACAQPAFADSQYSANWAGYAVHRSGVSFHEVSGSWREPNLACAGGKHTYSAYWLGLGGFSMSSSALEQIGTEADCSSQGAQVVSAWYELLPYAVPISMTVRPGDTMTASVIVAGHKVTMTLDDLTRGHIFSKVLDASTVDVSSAEWIVEAPSQCFGQSSCTILPLAAFGSTTFTAAAAQSANGHTGPISDPAWSLTKVNLTPNGRGPVSIGVGSGTGALASPLRAGGTSFRVTYSRLTVQGSSVSRRPATAVAAAVGGAPPSIRVTPRR
jgi:Peptidase A4 family